MKRSNHIVILLVILYDGPIGAHIDQPIEAIHRSDIDNTAAERLLDHLIQSKLYTVEHAIQIDAHDESLSLCNITVTA